MSKSDIVKARILSKSNCKCVLCGKELDLQSMTIDHYIPIDKGGNSQFINLYTACEKCNKHKSNNIVSPKDYSNYLNISYEYTLEMLLKQWSRQKASARRKKAERLKRKLSGNSYMNIPIQLRA